MGGNMSSDHPPKKVMNFSFRVESGGSINIYPAADSPLPLPSSSSPAKEITYPSPHRPHPSPPDSNNIPAKEITHPSPPPPPPSPSPDSRDNIPKKDITYPSPPSPGLDDKVSKEITHPSPPPPEETRKKKETKSSDTCSVLNPGVFSDFGKKANDLLTKDYYNKDMNKNFINLGTHSNANAGVDLTLTSLKKKKNDTTTTTTSTTIDDDTTTSATIDDDDTTTSTIDGLSIDDLTLIYKSKNNHNNSIHLKINAIENGVNCYSTTTQAQYELVPDIMNIFMSMEYPDMNRGGGSKVGYQYFIPNLTASSSLGLGHDQSPIFEGSATFGTPSFAFGGDVVSNLKESEIHFRAGIRLSNLFFDDFSVVVSDDKTLKCSSVQYLDSKKKSCFVADLKKSFLNNEFPTLTMGTSFEVDHHFKEEMKTVVKAKLDSHGNMGLVLQQHLMKDKMVKICSEFDTKDLNKTPKIGLSLVL